MGMTSVDSLPSKRLLDWFDKNNVRWDPSAVQLSTGLHAKKPTFRVKPTVRLAKDLGVAGIPKKVILSPRTCGASNLFEDVELPSGLLSLALSLIFERDVIGQKSPWWPFVSQIPQKGDRRIPPLWTKEEIDGFKYTSAEHHVKAAIQEFDARYEQFVVPLIKGHPESFPQTRFSKLQVLAALDVIAYRAFAVDEYHVVALIPFADSLERVSYNANSTLDIHDSVCISCGAAGECDHNKTKSDDDNPMDPELFDALEEMDSDPEGTEDEEDQENDDQDYSDDMCEDSDGEEGDDFDNESEPDCDEELIQIITLTSIRNSASSSLSIMQGNLGMDSEDVGAPNAHLISTFGFAVPRNPLDPIVVDVDEIAAACVRIGADEEVVHTARQVIGADKKKAEDNNDISRLDSPFGKYAFIPVIDHHQRSQPKNIPRHYLPGPNLLRLLITCNLGSQLIRLWKADKDKTMQQVEEMALYYEWSGQPTRQREDKNWADLLLPFEHLDPLVNACAVELASQRSKRIPIWTVRDAKKKAPTPAEAMARTLRESELWALEKILGNDIGCCKSVC